MIGNLDQGALYMISRLFLFSLICAVFSFGFVQAGSAEETDAAEVEKPMTVYEEIEAFTKELDEPSQQHFYALYGSYNLIKVVEDVQNQVGKAIDKCADANPDMKDALKTRHKDWTKAIKPIMKEANANVDNMIIAQEYAKKKEVKRILKLNDELRENKAGDVDKFPVTTPEACEYLRVKMDETEANLTELLRSTLVSLPQSLLRDGEEDDHGHEHDEGEEDHDHEDKDDKKKK